MQTIKQPSHQATTMLRLSLKSGAFFFCGIAFFILSLLSSCEKEVKIKLKGGDTKVVVEGAVETDVPPYVVLTKSIGFFSKIDLSTLENSFIHGANVTVSDGTKTITLREYTVDTGSLNKFSFYSIDTANLANKMTGENGKTYTLTITYDGKTYQAETKIPFPKGMDSIWAGDAIKFGDSVAAGARTVYVNYKDPDTLGNFGVYYTQINSQGYFMSDDIVTDEFTNGSLQTKYPLSLGIDPAHRKDRNNDSLGYVFPGDTVTLKWCSTDKKVYDFWRTFIYARNVQGNPFSTPINLKTNISNGALGIWAGYGTIYTTFVVQ